jgi:mRNA-degrading endonuclease toxin of MazEF toxin-antitoxin module
MGRWWQGRVRNARPRPGEVWWVKVPYRDGLGDGKVQPCLVIRRRPWSLTVLKITTRRTGEALPIPTRSWDRKARRENYLNLADPVAVRRPAFRRRAGVCDPAVFEQARRR